MYLNQKKLVAALFTATLLSVVAWAADGPVAVAGPKGTQISVPHISLDATRSQSPSGAALTYKWVFIPAIGESVTFSDDTSATPSVVIADHLFAFGLYTFELTVTDANGLTSTDVVDFLYLEPEEPLEAQPIGDVSR